MLTPPPLPLRSERSASGGAAVSHEQIAEHAPCEADPGTLDPVHHYLTICLLQRVRSQGGFTFPIVHLPVQRAPDAAEIHVQ